MRRQCLSKQCIQRVEGTRIYLPVTVFHWSNFTPWDIMSSHFWVTYIWMLRKPCGILHFSINESYGEGGEVRDIHIVGAIRYSSWVIIKDLVQPPQEDPQSYISSTNPAPGSRDQHKLLPGNLWPEHKPLLCELFFLLSPWRLSPVITVIRWDSSLDQMLLWVTHSCFDIEIFYYIQGQTILYLHCTFMWMWVLCKNNTMSKLG